MPNFTFARRWELKVVPFIVPETRAPLGLVILDLLETKEGMGEPGQVTFTVDGPEKLRELGRIFNAMADRLEEIDKPH